MDPLMRFVRWLSSLGWYDDRTQVARERRTNDAQFKSSLRTDQAARTAREIEGRVTATRKSFAEAGRRLSR